MKYSWNEVALNLVLEESLHPQWMSLHGCHGPQVPSCGSIVSSIQVKGYCLILRLSTDDSSSKV